MYIYIYIGWLFFAFDFFTVSFLASLEGLVGSTMGGLLRPWLDGNDVENVFFASLGLKTFGGLKSGSFGNMVDGSEIRRSAVDMVVNLPLFTGFWCISGVFFCRISEASTVSTKKWMIWEVYRPLHSCMHGHSRNPGPSTALGVAFIQAGQAEGESPFER